LAYSIHMVNPRRGVIFYRIGAVGVTPQLAMFSVNPATREIALVGSPIVPSGITAGTRTDFRASPNANEFIYSRAASATMETSIYSIHGDVFTELATLTKAGLTTFNFRTIPVGCSQGPMRIAYLSGGGVNGLHVVEMFGVPAAATNYFFRPGGVDQFFRPGGVDQYERY